MRKHFSTTSFNFDFFVIGGGSGGIAAATQASELGVQTGIADFVTPTPKGTKWGLGGTCVNVGCIPKKLFHQAGLIYESLGDLENIGYTGEINKNHNWEQLVDNVQLHVKVKIL